MTARARAPRVSLPRGASVAAVILLAFLAIPVVALLARAISSGRFADAARARIVVDALVLSVVTTSLSLAIIVALGTPLALLLTRRAFRGRALVEGLVDLPIVLPPSVAGLALLLAFGRRGLLGEPLAGIGIGIPFSVVAVIFAQVFVAAPFFVRAARAGFAAIETDVEDAARVDGAGGWALLRYVTIPLASSALSAGLVLAWARALGEFGATIMFAGNIAGLTQTLPLVVYSEFQVDLDSSIAAASLLAMAALAVLLAVRLTRWRTALDERVAG